jgi:hypothetical protein
MDPVIPAVLKKSNPAAVFKEPPSSGDKLDVTINGKVVPKGSTVDSDTKCTSDSQCFSIGLKSCGSSKFCHVESAQDKFEWSIDIKGWPYSVGTDALDLAVSGENIS